MKNRDQLSGRFGCRFLVSIDLKKKKKQGESKIREV